MKFHSLSLAMLAINSASCSVYASASDEPSTSTQSSLRGMFLNEDEESTRGLKRGDGDEDVCGTEPGNECVSTLNARSSYKLMECFNRDLPFMDTNVTIVEYFDGPGENVTVFKLTFPQVDFEDFEKANFNAGLGQPRIPAAIFYAEDEDEVIKAVNCSREAGYKVSPRGRGHSYQGLSSMDGYMVIDMSLMCNPEDFVRTPLDQPWLLGGGQKVIGSIKSGSGCTNAVMLAYTAKYFPEGLYSIGACPSVGITGYATGGGQGDTTPWVGLGIDDVLSYDVVLYDGTSVTASPTEHEDLYWALRGGGSGFGVITNITTAIIGAPEEDSKFTWVLALYKQTQNEAREFLKRFQDFLMPDLPIGSKEYKEKVRATSARFGGGAGFNTKEAFGLNFAGLYLGNESEANSTFEEAGLRDPALLLPNIGYNTIEFSSYADVQLFRICNGMGSPALLGLPWMLWVNPTGSYNGTEGANPFYSVDICEQLGINSTKYCLQRGGDLGTTLRAPNCDPGDGGFDPDALINVILPALKEVAIKPQSWFNRPGGQRIAEVGYEALRDGNPAGAAYASVALDSYVGGLLHGRLDPEVLLEMANVGVSVNHLAHGAPTLLERDETAYFGREEYSLLEFVGPDAEGRYDKITSILVDQAYDGDASKLRGFYNYLNIEGNRNWREYYFGDNYERLSVVKAKYDETNGFGNPLQVEPAPLSSKSGKGDENLFG